VFGALVRKTLEESVENITLPEVPLDDVAWIISTSGSSSEPRAVVTEHLGYCSLVVEQAKHMSIKFGSRVLQVAPYNFSACIIEILITLVLGGCVCVLSKEERFNDLVGSIHKYDVLWAVMLTSSTSILDPNRFQIEDTGSGF